MILWGFMAKPSLSASLCDAMTKTDLTPAIVAAAEKYPENISIDPENGIRIKFPKDEIGGDSGISQQIRLVETPVHQACLTYQVRFPAEFLFVRGGKLPGLYGGPANMKHSNASGCIDKKNRLGWTMRLMWRDNGMGEGYGYFETPDDRCGTSFDRGAWVFPRQQWVDVGLYQKINRAGQSDGVLKIIIDGRLVVDRDDLDYGDDAGIHGLFLSSFFGGSDKSWAPPTDQFLELRNFAFFTGGLP